MTAAEAERQDANRQELLDDLLELCRLGIVQIVVKIDADENSRVTFQLTPGGERKAAEFAWRLLRRGTL